jgi:putative acyl-CoA dehydrogenase
MRNVLADLAVESEAATALAMRLALAADRDEVGLKRLGTALGKYWVCKRGPAFVAEALECLGGNGYIEDSGMPRLYRESPLNSIWEGAGNVQALDVVRILSRTPEAAEAVLDEIAQGGTSLQNPLDDVRKQLGDAPAEFDSRRIAEHLAVLLQASLLIRFAPPAVADAFRKTRVDGEGGLTFGTLPHSVDLEGILVRTKV